MSFPKITHKNQNLIVKNTQQTHPHIPAYFAVIHQLHAMAFQSLAQDTEQHHLRTQYGEAWLQIPHHCIYLAAATTRDSHIWILFLWCTGAADISDLLRSILSPQACIKSGKIIIYWISDLWHCSCCVCVFSSWGRGDRVLAFRWSVLRVRRVLVQFWPTAGFLCPASFLMCWE